MEEILWRMRRHSQDLQELRGSIRGLWDDDAAREINSRYLNPHQEDTRRISTALLAQNDALEQSQAHVQAAVKHESQAKEFAVIVKQSLEFTAQESRQALNHHDQSLQQTAIGKELLPQISELIQSANSSC